MEINWVLEELEKVASEQTKVVRIWERQVGKIWGPEDQILQWNKITRMCTRSWECIIQHFSESTTVTWMAGLKATGEAPMEVLRPCSPGAAGLHMQQWGWRTGLILKDARAAHKNAW